MDDADVKKECPSCGLGVALDARICEFCGWDFQEEDEWILQIEKLERDLVLEKQKFEPGSVGGKIEASLHTPSAVKKEQLKASAAKAKLQKEMEEVLGAPETKEPLPPPQPKPAPPAPAIHERAEAAGPSSTRPVVRELRPKEILPVVVHEPEPEIMEAPPARTSGATPSSGKVRRVRKVKGASQTAEPAQQPSKTKPAKKS